MESLRWVLLAAGIAFVIVIYMLGRSRKQRYSSMVDELEEELPDFAANSLDDLDEGVGEVRVVSRSSDNGAADEASIDISANRSSSEVDDAAVEPQGEDASQPSGIIVLYILAKTDQSLLGSQINSSVQAMGLAFGEMNIFHFHRADRNVFSLANMLEPGSFDENTIHDMKTSGLSVFMQIGGDDPLDDLTEMLQRSYQLAGLLDAILCNHRRQPLTEQDAEDYRKQVTEFAAARAETTADTTA